MSEHQKRVRWRKGGATTLYGVTLTVEALPTGLWEWRCQGQPPGMSLDLRGYARNPALARRDATKRLRGLALHHGWPRRASRRRRKRALALRPPGV